MSHLPIAVIGGGISGLSCAFYLSRYCKELLKNRKIYVIEGSSKIGGWLRSRRFDDGVIHELGPRSIRCNALVGINTINLIEELGLGDELIGTCITSPAAKKRLIYMDGNLVKLPSGFMEMYRPFYPFKKSLFQYCMEEVKRNRTYIEPDGDISIHEFVAKRFDPQFAEILADPFCRGITAGNSRTLSLRSMFPPMFFAHEKAGSVISGMMLFKKKLGRKEPFVVEKGDLFKSTRAWRKRWTSFNFKNGLSTFSEGFQRYFDQLEDQQVQVMSGAIVDSIEFDKKSGSARVTAMKERSVKSLEVSHVFSSIPAHNLSMCLKDTPAHNLSMCLKEDPGISELKSLLDQIKSVDVAVVTLEFEGKDILEPDAGFGFLVPSGEKSIKLLGITFDSCVFEEHDAGKYITRITCMMGGHWFNEYFGPANKVDWSNLVSIAVCESQKILKFKKDPIRHTVRVHQKCIPQYEVNHHRLIRKIMQSAEKLPLDMIGSSFTGISVNDVILGARRAVHHYNDRMTS